MVKKIFVLIAALVFAFSLAACPDNNAGDAPITQSNPASNPHGAGGTPTGPISVGPTQVVVPDEVKSTWSGVKLELEDKAADKRESIEVDINGEYKIPDSNLVIKVGDFLPDFKMDGSTITSVTSELKNPAVQVWVMEGEEEIFKGWLYQNFPAIHPFQHEKYGLQLLEGVKKG